MSKMMQTIAGAAGAFLLPAAVLAVNPHAIVPGQSIGHIRLGEFESSVTKALGEPTDSEGAATDVFDTWQTVNGHKLEAVSGVIGNFTDAVPPSEGNERLVLQVRVTSPYFVTTKGISTGCRLGQILRAYPAACLWAHVVPNGTQKTLFVYDEVKRGIAFEVTAKSGPSARCAAIVIHLPGLGLAAGGENVEGYLQYHPILGFHRDTAPFLYEFRHQRLVRRPVRQP